MYGDKMDEISRARLAWDWKVPEVSRVRRGK